MSLGLTRRGVLSGLACLPALGGFPAAAAQAAPIEMAVMPFLSTRQLVERYEPMCAFIEARLHRPAYIVTAPDFRTFVRRTQAGTFGFVLTAPHLGRLAEVEAGYRPLLQWRAPLGGVFLVGRDSPIRSLGDLRGHDIGTPERLAVVTMLGEETLQAAGLVPGTDVTLSPMPSHNAALLAVLRGETAAALVSATVLVGVESQVGDRLRPLARTARMSVASVFMAGPHLGEDEARSLRAALLAFARGESGRRFLADNGYQDIVPVPRGALAAFDRFLPAVRRLLAEPERRR